jgi:putative peptide zinc metalloprotease protein
MLEPQSASNNTLPKLKSGLRISPFHEGAAGERYLVEVGETCFVAGKPMRDVLLALSEEPKTLEELAEAYKRKTGDDVSTQVLADVLAHRISDSLFDHTPEPKNKRPFIFSFDLIPEHRVRPFSTAFAVLFAKPFVFLIVTCFLLAELFIFTHTLSAIQVPFQPWDLLLFYISIIGITLFHELGHAAACRRFECPHGNIGFALYFIYPVFYTDVTKVWRLPRLKRAVVDLGGIYFQAIPFVMLTLYVVLTENLFALRLLWAMNFMMFFTLNPFFKMDGYWLLSDLSGLSNLHQQMRDTIVRAGKKLFRRPMVVPAPQVQGVRLKVLYAYIALALAYILFIVQFLYGSITYVVESYPQRAAYFLEMILRTYVDGNSERAWQYTARLAYESVWPLILSVLVCVVAYRLIRRICGTIKGVMSGYTLTISIPRWSYIVGSLVSAWKARGARQG